MVSIVGRKIGQMPSARRNLPAGDASRNITGALLIAGLAVDRSKVSQSSEHLEFSPGRRQKRFGGFELSLAAQQIGEMMRASNRSAQWQGRGGRILAGDSYQRARRVPSANSVRESLGLSDKACSNCSIAWACSPWAESFNPRA